MTERTVMVMSNEGRGDEQRLWYEYQQLRSPAAREALILQYASLVKYVAGRIAIGLPPNVDFDDLVSYGIFGLMDAIDKYEAARGIKFETYAIARIRGQSWTACGATTGFPGLSGRKPGKSSVPVWIWRTGWGVLQQTRRLVRR